MKRTELEQNFREYLKYHVEDRDPRLVEFYMRTILKEAWGSQGEENEETKRYAEKRRADLLKRFT